MTGVTTTGVRARLVGAAAVAGAGLLAMTGCARLADTAGSAAEAIPSPAPATMRLDKPKLLLDRWPESIDRSLHAPAQQNMGNFKKLLGGAPTSAVGTAYVTAEEEYSRERGFSLPDDGAAILVSGVSGTVDEPEATFIGFPRTQSRADDFRLIRSQLEHPVR